MLLSKRAKPASGTRSVLSEKVCPAAIWVRSTEPTRSSVGAMTATASSTSKDPEKCRL